MQVLNLLTMRKYVLVFIILLCASCAEKNDDVLTFDISFDKQRDTETLHSSELVSSVRHIRINNVDKWFNPCEKIKYVGGLYYLVNRKDASIVIVDEEGNVLHCLNKRGRKNDEYVSLSDFDVNPANGDICIYDESSAKVLVYSVKGSLIRSFRLDSSIEWYRGFSVLEDGGYLCYLPDYNRPDGGVKPRRGLWRADEKGVFQDYLLTFDEDFKLVQFRTTGYFCRLSDGTICLIGEEDKDHVYHITPDGKTLSVAYRFRYDRKIPSSTLKRDTQELSASDSFYYKFLFRETDNWLFLVSLSFPDNKYSYLIYDKRKNKEYQMTSNNNDISGDLWVGALGTNAASDRMMRIEEEDDAVNIVVTYLR